jgi:glycerol-3-phosphate dehydrogenase
VIHIDNSGLLTICGGKWTTYRHMAEDCVNQAATLAGLPEKPSITRHLNIHGFHPAARKFGALSVYGSDALEIQKLTDADPALAEPLHPALPYVKAEVVWAARSEMARTVEDVLARRTRALFLNACAAMQMASPVADLLAHELSWDDTRKAGDVAAFRALAANYIVH